MTWIELGRFLWDDAPNEVFMIVLSCGLVVTCPDGWLLAHATRTPRWDLPKGRQEPGETPLQTALRETWEETNLDLSSWQSRIMDLGQHRYLRQKDLHVFRLDLPHALDLADCRCHTMVERADGQSYPETDQWAWVPPELLRGRLGQGMVQLLDRLALLPSAETPSLKR